MKIESLAADLLAVTQSLRSEQQLGATPEELRTLKRVLRILRDAKAAERFRAELHLLEMDLGKDAQRSRRTG